MPREYFQEITDPPELRIVVVFKDDTLKTYYPGAEPSPVLELMEIRKSSAPLSGEKRPQAAGRFAHIVKNLSFQLGKLEPCHGGPRYAPKNGRFRDSDHDRPQPATVDNGTNSVTSARRPFCPGQLGCRLMRYYRSRPSRETSRVEAQQHRCRCICPSNLFGRSGPI